MASDGALWRMKVNIQTQSKTDCVMTFSATEPVCNAVRAAIVDLEGIEPEAQSIWYHLCAWPIKKQTTLDAVMALIGGLQREEDDQSLASLIEGTRNKRRRFE